ncbi:MAG TPA: VTT domain-containing protein [Thermoleophilaceae bacterium]|nr:VTT domain-containing protein [Thermoleophilaceae bacterium]
MTRTRIALAGALVAIVVAVVASGVLSDLPDPKTVIEDVALALGPWTYALVGVLAFLETGAFVGLVAPGETVVIAGGVVAGQGEIDLLPLIGLVWTCAVLGDTTSFFIGRRLGRGFLERHGPKLRITPERLGQVEGYFQRHGGKTILIGRFIGLVRALAPFIAGSSGLAYGRFVPFSIVGCGLWASVFCVLGYLFWQSFDTVVEIPGQATFAFGVTAAAIVVGVWAYRRLRRPEQRRRVAAWLEAHRLTRPAVTAVRALPPIGLSLELATALAVAGVGAYVFVLYTILLSADPGPTPFDVGSLEIARDLYGEAQVEVAKVVTAFGSLPAAIVLVVAGGVVLARHGRLADAVALLAGLAIIYAAVHLAKAGVDRDRPSIPLVDTARSSFPSGHAGYSTAWVAVGVALSGAVRLGRRAALVLGAIAVAAAVGASRIYLRVHYWSDVAGGWALGFAVFGTLAAGLLLVSHMRQNEPRSRRPAGGRRPSTSR